MKKDKENVEKNSKKRWGFVKSVKDSGASGQIPANKEGDIQAAWLRSYISDAEKEQNKHAIAVAAATAAAADAAVAAAQAAVAVIRLTRQGRRASSFGGGEKWAAVKIQTVFRGYLVSGIFEIIFLYFYGFVFISEFNLVFVNCYSYSISLNSICYLIICFGWNYKIDHDWNHCVYPFVAYI